MESVNRSIAQRAVKDRLVKEAERIISMAPNMTTNITSKLLKMVNLRGGDWKIWNGEKVILKRTNLGAGVYKVWYELEK